MGMSIYEPAKGSASKFQGCVATRAMKSVRNALLQALCLESVPDKTTRYDAFGAELNPLAALEGEDWERAQYHPKNYSRA